MRSFNLIKSQSGSGILFTLGAVVLISLSSISVLTYLSQSQKSVELPQYKILRDTLRRTIQSRLEDPEICKAAFASQINYTNQAQQEKIHSPISTDGLPIDLDLNDTELGVLLNSGTSLGTYRLNIKSIKAFGGRSFNIGNHEYESLKISLQVSSQGLSSMSSEIITDDISAEIATSGPDNGKITTCFNDESLKILACSSIGKIYFPTDNPDYTTAKDGTPIIDNNGCISLIAADIPVPPNLVVYPPIVYEPTFPPPPPPPALPFVPTTQIDPNAKVRWGWADQPPMIPIIVSTGPYAGNYADYAVLVASALAKKEASGQNYCIRIDSEVITDGFGPCDTIKTDRPGKNLAVETNLIHPKAPIEPPIAMNTPAISSSVPATEQTRHITPLPITSSPPKQTIMPVPTPSSPLPYAAEGPACLDKCARYYYTN